MFQNLKKLSHVNSYYGRSIPALIMYNAFQFSGFFRRRGPSKDLLLDTARVRATKNGKSALILGSGPSLDLLVPSLARQHFDDIFVVNSYYKYKHSSELLPDYYALSDPNFFVETNKTIFHESVELNDYLRVSNPTLLISHFNRKQIPNVTNEILYFDDRELPRFLGGGISPLKPRNYISMTLYKALAMAIHMGYEKIYVLGMDNSEFASYRSNVNHEISRESRVYFAESMKWAKMPDYSNPEVLPGGIAGHVQMLATFFGDLYKFSGYEIYNLDENSLVDAFPKIRNHPSIDSNKRKL